MKQFQIENFEIVLFIFCKVQIPRHFSICLTYNNHTSNTFRHIVITFLESNERGYWETSKDNIERLNELYAEVLDRMEGV